MATVAYGSADHPNVVALRQLRDGILSGSATGARAMRLVNIGYYELGRVLAQVLTPRRGWTRVVRRLAVDPGADWARWVAKQSEGIEDPAQRARVAWAYVVGSVLLVVGAGVGTVLGVLSLLRWATSN